MKTKPSPSLQKCRKLYQAHRRRAGLFRQSLDYDAAGLLRKLEDTVTFGETRCRYCALVLHPGNWTADHATPTGAGGSYSIHNLNLDVCLTCNEVKGCFTDRQFQDLRALAREWAERDGLGGGHAGVYLFKMLRLGLRKQILMGRRRSRTS